MRVEVSCRHRISRLRVDDLRKFIKERRVDVLDSLKMLRAFKEPILMGFNIIVPYGQMTVVCKWVVRLVSKSTYLMSLSKSCVVMLSF